MMNVDSLRIVFLCFLSMSLFILLGCFGDERIPNVSKHIQDVSIHRYDRDLDEISKDFSTDNLSAFASQYPDFYHVYFQQLLGLPIDDESRIQEYLEDSRVKSMLDTLGVLFPNLEKSETELEQAFAFVRHYFPEYDIPQVDALFGNFSYQAFLYEKQQKSAIGLSLEMFLGESFPYKSLDPTNPLFSDYIAERYNAKYLVKKTMELVAEDILGPQRGKRFLDHAIYQGKKLVLMQKFLPETSLDILLEYSEPQLDWCQQSEKAIWDFVLEQNLIYETNQQKINSYVNEAPRSKGMPEASPGRTAHFLGYKIVSTYLEKTGKDINALISETDNESLFQRSKYKPKRN